MPVFSQKLTLSCCRFELRLKVTISEGKLALTPSVRNVGDKPFSFTFAVSNYLSVSDIRFFDSAHVL